MGEEVLVEVEVEVELVVVEVVCVAERGLESVVLIGRCGKPDVQSRIG